MPNVQESDRLHDSMHLTSLPDNLDYKYHPDVQSLLILYVPADTQNSNPLQSRMGHHFHIKKYDIVLPNHEFTHFLLMLQSECGFSLSGSPRTGYSFSDIYFLCTHRSQMYDPLP